MFLPRFERNFMTFRWFPKHYSSEIPWVEYFSKSSVFFCFKVFTLKNNQISCLFRGFLRSFDTICTPSTLLSHRKLLASDHSVSKIMEYRNYFVKQFTKRTKKYFSEIQNILCHGVSVNPSLSLFSNIIRSVCFGKPQNRKFESKRFFRYPPLFRSKYFRKLYDFHFSYFFLRS